jgi:AraC family transcriptional activator of pobA
LGTAAPTPTGYFCIFNQAFLLPVQPGLASKELPIFHPGSYPLWEVSDAQASALRTVFEKMAHAITSPCAYKYDLLCTYLCELIHVVQQQQPAGTLAAGGSATARLAAKFRNLLERQFSLPGPGQRLRAPTYFADKLAVHVNTLNWALKEATGYTTTVLIAKRLTQEAKLLRQTSWSITQIAEGLGFTDTAHFCTFFKWQTTRTPGSFRS